MALQNGKQSSDDILDSQAHICNQIFSFIKPMSLKCAIQLQIPDIINNHGAPMTLSELTEALPISKHKSHFVCRLMGILVHSGFFLVSKTEEVDGGEGEGYTLAPASRLLLKDEPLSLRPFLLAMLDPVMVDPCQDMSEWFQNDDVNPFQTTHGRTLWDYAGHEPKLNRLLNDAMASDGNLVMSVVAREGWGVFKGLNSIVDVGGGTGTVAKAIAKAFPDIRCINFDLPHVVGGLEGSKNLSYVAGDMFEGIPTADAVLLKLILHDWSDEDCIKILKRCKEAIPRKEKGGKIMIIDIVMTNEEREDKVLETKLFFDMLMMIEVMGKERSEKEWAKLFFDAGFSDYKIFPIFGLRSLIEVYP